MVPLDSGSKNMPPNYGNLGDHQKVPYSATVGWTEWSHVIIMCVHTETANRDSHGAGAKTGTIFPFSLK